MVVDGTRLDQSRSSHWTEWLPGYRIGITVRLRNKTKTKVVVRAHGAQLAKEIMCPGVRRPEIRWRSDHILSNALHDQGSRAKQ